MNQEQENMALEKKKDDGAELFSEEDFSGTGEDASLPKDDTRSEADSFQPATQEGKTETPNAKIKVKFNRKEMELGEDEAAPLIQKGLNYDKINERLSAAAPVLEKAEVLAQSLGFESTDELFSAAEQNGINFSNIQSAKNSTAAREHEVDKFMEAYPNARSLPEEVIQSIDQGMTLMDAYHQYETNQAAAKAEELEREVRLLRHNKAMEERAPVSSATLYGKSQTGKDEFEMGFDEEWKR